MLSLWHAYFKACSQHVNMNKVQLTNEDANSNVNSRIGMHVLRTNRAQTFAFAAVNINTKYSRDADARDQ